MSTSAEERGARLKALGPARSPGTSSGPGGSPAPPGHPQPPEGPGHCPPPRAARPALTMVPSRSKEGAGHGGWGELGRKVGAPLTAGLGGSPTWARRPLRPLLPGQPAPQLLPFSSPFCSSGPRGSGPGSLLPASCSGEPAPVLAPHGSLSPRIAPPDPRTARRRQRRGVPGDDAITVDAGEAKPYPQEGPRARGSAGGRRVRLRWWPGGRCWWGDGQERGGNLEEKAPWGLGSRSRPLRLREKGPKVLRDPSPKPGVQGVTAARARGSGRRDRKMGQPRKDCFRFHWIF